MRTLLGSSIALDISVCGRNTQRFLLLAVDRSDLMRRGDALGFNLASLLKAYYGLDALKGTFSLNIQPYQLARLSADYRAFCQAMNL